MYNDEFELTFDLADAGPKTEQRRPTLPEPEEAAVTAPPVQETRETPVSAAPENTPAPEREPGPAAEPRSTAPAAKGRTVLISGGDRGIGEAYGCELDLPKTIANGDDICHLRYHKK